MLDLSSFPWQELLLVIGTAVALFLKDWLLGKKPAPAYDPTHVPPVVVEPEIHQFDMGDFTPLARAALAGNSKSAVTKAAAALLEKPKQGRPVALMVEKLMQGLLKQLYENPKTTANVINFISLAILKVPVADLLKLIKDRAPPVASLLIGFLLLLGLAGNANAEPLSPQRFYGDEVRLPVTEPLMWSQGKLVAYRANPEAPQHAGVYGPDGSDQPQHATYSNGTRRRPVRRIAFAPFRWLFCRGR